MKKVWEKMREKGGGDGSPLVEERSAAGAGGEVEKVGENVGEKIGKEGVTTRKL